MAAPTKLFLDHNSIDDKWKVLDEKEFCFGSGETPEDAIASARVVTNAPIYSNKDFKGLIDGRPVIPTINANEIETDDLTIYGTEEIIEALAELGGFKVRKVVEDGFFIGYTMELIE